MKTLLLLLLCGITIAGRTQANIQKFYWNSKLEAVPEQEAVITGEGTKGANGFTVNYFDAKDNRLMLSSVFLDSTLTIYNGFFQSYHKNSKIEKTGNYKMDKEEGLWTKNDSLGRNIDSSFYNAGKKMSSIKLFYWENGRVKYREVIDSIADTYNGLDYDGNGVINRQFVFKGQLGEETTFKNGNITKDSLYTREEKEAEFPGGAKAWIKYLQENLNPNVGFKKKIKPGVYQVIIKFIIDKDGTVTDIQPETSFGFGLENEAVRIIKKSGRWIPAKQFGRYVNAYRRQPITYVYE